MQRRNVRKTTTRTPSRTPSRRKPRKTTTRRRKRKKSSANPVLIILLAAAIVLIVKNDWREALVAKLPFADKKITISEETAQPTETVNSFAGLDDVVVRNADGTEVTSSPTETPTQTEKPVETEAPTEKPTETPAPTVIPTEAPTPVPTEIPTIPPAATDVPSNASLSSVSVRSPYFASGDYVSPYNADGTISNRKFSWNYIPNKEFQPPHAAKELDVRNFNAFYLGDIYSKNIYLTFDEGYEAGYSDKILDTLKEKNVKATFFVTEPYITKNPLIVKRMVNEGHIVGNHTIQHLSSPDLSDEQFLAELAGVEVAYRKLIGTDIPKFFRPPAGDYSARILKLAKDAGYATVFWSFAYRDWLIDAQPPRNSAYEHITSSMHGGAIPLFHAMSETNAAVIGDVIDFLLEKDCTFKQLSDIIIE